MRRAVELKIKMDKATYQQLKALEMERAEAAAKISSLI